MVVSLSLLVVGIWMFFWLHAFIIGAIVLASHSLYQLPAVLMMKKNDPKIVVNNN